MKEVVKYHNELNSIRFDKFRASDYDLFMVICAKLKEQGTEVKQISYAELRKLAKYSQTDNADLYNSLEGKISSLATSTVKKQISPRHTKTRTLFEEFDNDGEACILTVSVTSKSLELLNNLTANFTRFELEEFVGLKTKYQKNLYRNLKQFRTTGDLTISAEDFRIKLDIPKSYPNKAIKSKIIDPTVKALRASCFPDLKCDPKYASKPGRPVVGYCFSFTPEAPDRQLTIEDWQKDEKKLRNKMENSFGKKMELSNYGDMGDLESQIIDN